MGFFIPQGVNILRGSVGTTEDIDVRGREIKITLFLPVSAWKGKDLLKAELLRSVFYFSFERHVFESVEMGFTKQTLKFVKGHVYGFVTVL